MSGFCSEHQGHDPACPRCLRPGMKLCSRCMRERPRTQFAPRRYSARRGKIYDGVHSWCRECKRAYDREAIALKRKQQ